MKLLRSPVLWSVATAFFFVIALFEPLTAFRHDARIVLKSNGQPNALGELPVLCEALSDPSRITEIDLTVRIRRIKPFQGVFQTAPENNGVRLEISESGSLGLSFRSADVPGGYGGIASEGVLLKGQLNKISIRFEDASKVSLSLNDGPELVFDGQITADCSDVKVGTGFDSSRDIRGAVDGEIRIGREVRVTYFGLPYGVRQVGQVAFVLSAIGLIAVISFECGRQIGRAHV